MFVLTLGRMPYSGDMKGMDQSEADPTEAYEREDHRGRHPDAGAGDGTDVDAETKRGHRYYGQDRC